MSNQNRKDTITTVEPLNELISLTQSVQNITRQLSERKDAAGAPKTNLQDQLGRHQTMSPMQSKPGSVVRTQESGELLTKPMTSLSTYVMRENDNPGVADTMTLTSIN